MCVQFYVRVTGDLWWHLGWNKGTPVSSMNVELVDGNVENITRFKLLLPAARYGANEVFTAILKQLGFLAPRTFYKRKNKWFYWQLYFSGRSKKRIFGKFRIKGGTNIRR